MPFMMQVFQIREEKRRAHSGRDPRGRLGPAADGHERRQPALLRLIEAFRDLTGVPMVLNTSFNENEPVVCTTRARRWIASCARGWTCW